MLKRLDHIGIIVKDLQKAQKGYAGALALKAGGAEELCPSEAAVFDTLFATSQRNDAPKTTPSPFDVQRDGLVIGEEKGQFVGIEMKEHGWRFTGRGRERAQMNFGELVIKLGGRFSFHSGGVLE